MRKVGTLFAVVALFALCAPLARAAEKRGDAKVPAALSFKMKGIDGKEVDLAQYKGKVVLIVNVASQCGYTKQYKGLQAIYEKYKNKGFVILGVPANDFGMQEPGTDAEIVKFCSSKYGVTFPMLAKVSTIVGDDKVPLYKHLTSKETDPKFAGEIKWNFTKFLIGRNGEIVNRFDSKITPESEELTKAVEEELAKK